MKTDEVFSKKRVHTHTQNIAKQQVVINRSESCLFIINEYTHFQQPLFGVVIHFLFYIIYPFRVLCIRILCYFFSPGFFFFSHFVRCFFHLILCWMYCAMVVDATAVVIALMAFGGVAAALLSPSHRAWLRWWPTKHREGDEANRIMCAFSVFTTLQKRFRFYDFTILLCHPFI